MLKWLTHTELFPKFLFIMRDNRSCLLWWQFFSPAYRNMLKNIAVIKASNKSDSSNSGTFYRTTSCMRPALISCCVLLPFSAGDDWTLPGGVFHHIQTSKARSARYRSYTFFSVHPSQINCYIDAIKKYKRNVGCLSVCRRVLLLYKY